MRLDPTIQYDDILVRMYRPARPASFNPLNMRRLRARDNLDLILWERRSMKGNDNARTRRILARTPAHQVAANTTMAPTPVAAGPSTTQSSNMTGRVDTQSSTPARVPPFALTAPTPNVRISTTRQAHTQARLGHFNGSGSASTFFSGMGHIFQPGRRDQEPILSPRSSRRSLRLRRRGTTSPTPRSTTVRRTSRRHIAQTPAVPHDAILGNNHLNNFPILPGNRPAPTSAPSPIFDNITTPADSVSDQTSSPLYGTTHPLDLWPLTYGRVDQDQTYTTGDNARF